MLKRLFLSIVLLLITTVSFAGIEDILVFDYNKKVFTLYCFLNYTGFSDNNDMPFHPVRQSIINDIKSINPRIMDRNYYINKGYPRDYYDYPLMIMNNESPFRPDYYNALSPEILQNFGIIPQMIFEDKFPSVLNQFYNAANINYLFEKYRNVHYQEINRIKTVAIDALNFIIKEFKINTDIIDNKIIVDMSSVFLMESGRGEIRSNLPDISRDYAIVMAYGLNKDNPVDGSLFVHEVLHLFVDPILEKHRYLVDKLYEKRNVVGSTGMGPYDKYAFVNETFIRAIQNAHLGIVRNDDWIEFPLIYDIFSYYRSKYNNKTQNLEVFLVNVLNHLINGHTIKPEPETFLQKINKVFNYIEYGYKQIQPKQQKTYKDKNRFYRKYNNNVYLIADKGHIYILTNKYLHYTGTVSDWESVILNGYQYPEIFF